MGSYKLLNGRQQRALLIQTVSMKLHYPHFKSRLNENGNMEFIGSIQPKPAMPSYTVSIEFRFDAMPYVRVLTPLLVEKPPHFYHSIGCLCLYKPENFTWIASKPISNYIIPWTAWWLYFYEIWIQKGIWYGPEASHELNKQKL